MASIQSGSGGAAAIAIGTDAQTQTDSDPVARQQQLSSSSPPSDTMRANKNRQSYRPPHQLNSPDITYAGSAALLAAQHTSSPAAWTFDGNAGASAAASLAKAQSRPIEAWKPDKLSSAGAAASLAHKRSVSERGVPKDASASATAALRTRSSFESHEPAPLAVSAGASLTNSATHAMRAASMAHKPSMSKSPEQSKTLPSHAFRAASAADRDSNVIKLPSPKYYRSHEEAAPIQQLARELAKRDLSDANFSTGGVSRSDLTRIATLSMARKQTSDQAEQEKVDARKRRSEEEAQSEYSSHQDLDNAARRIVAERIARVTLTGEEGDEVLAGKAAGESINRGNERVRDWERVLKSLEDENKSDKERNMGWLRQSMRSSAPIVASRNDPSVIMAAAQRNVNSRLDQMDRTIAQEQLLLGGPTGENLARGDAATKDLEQRGTADLERKHKERASTYDIGGIIMTYEQVEAIAQKNVDEVLAEINENVQREKERIETERIERETNLREKQHEKDLARERAAEEKAEKDRIKSEQREQKAEEKRIKTETKLAERKKKEDGKIAQKELKAVQKEQLAVGEGVGQYDAQKDPEAELTHQQEEAAKHRALDEVQGDQVGAVNGLLEFGVQKDQEEFRKNVEDKVHVGRELAEVQEDQRASVGGVLGFDAQRDQEAYRKPFEKKSQTDGELAEVREDQPATAGTPLEYDPQKDQEACHKRVEEKQAAGSELAEAQNEQARAAEVLHPDTTLDDEVKGKGIKLWLKEKKDKIGKRLGRHISPESPTKLEPEEEEEEDLYGEQLPMTSNWREDSLRNVALAKHEHSDVAGGKMEEREPVEQASAEHVVEYTEESGDEEFNDVEENFEPKEPAGSSLAAKEEPRKLSSERGSRFKEEF